MTPQPTDPELFAIDNCPADPAFTFVFNTRPMYLFAKNHGLLREYRLIADHGQYVYSQRLDTEIYAHHDYITPFMRDHHRAVIRYKCFLTALQNEAADILHNAFPTNNVTGVTPLTFAPCQGPDPGLCNILILLARTLQDCDCGYHRAHLNDWPMWNVWATLTSHTGLTRHTTQKPSTMPPTITLPAISGTKAIPGWLADTTAHLITGDKQLRRYWDNLPALTRDPTLIILDNHQTDRIARGSVTGKTILVVVRPADWGEDINFYRNHKRITVPYYMVERYAPDLYQVLTQNLPERLSYKTPLTYENTYTL